MAGTVTVTGKTGPAITATAVVHTNVISVTIDMVNNVLTVFVLGTPSPYVYDVNAAATVTSTKSGTTWTLVIS
jgi:hypothetical protein